MDKLELDLTRHNQKELVLDLFKKKWPEERMHAEYQVASGTFLNDANCRPSLARDLFVRWEHEVRDQNASLINRYIHEEKITASGFPILNYVHIPKTGGDSFYVASAPLGNYCMGAFCSAMETVDKVDINARSPERCFFEQMPAMDLDYKVADFVYGESEVFCAVRNPYDRVWSAACHMQKYDSKLSSLSVDEVVRRSLAAYMGGDRHIQGCFWIPQVDYLQGRFGCKHILDFDNLESDYNKLVKQFGFEDLQLPPPNATHACQLKCDKRNMSAETLGLVEQIYAKDIAFWKEFRSERRNRSVIVDWVGHATPQTMNLADGVRD